MAATAGPRAGWSRRAQYGLFFAFLATVTGLLIGLVMLVLSLAAPDTYRHVRAAALDVTAPVTGALASAREGVQELGRDLGEYWNAANRNETLREQNAAMRREIVKAKAVLQENAQLKAALELREASTEAIATGRIVGSSFDSPRRFAILSAGSRDGVANGMPVRAADGLVGRIVDAGFTASRVLLVSDRSNIVPARIVRSDVPVLSTGRGDGTVDVRPIEVGRNPFKRGDIIVTSGTGGLYPPLVPIARIIRLDDDGAIAMPLADPRRVSFAIVEPPYEPDAAAMPDEAGAE